MDAHGWAEKADRINQPFKTNTESEAPMYQVLAGPQAAMQEGHMHAMQHDAG